MQSEEQKTLVDFSREVAETVLQFLEIYPDLYSNLEYLAQAEPGPSLQANLLDLRSGTAEIAQTLTVISRTIEGSADSYSEYGVEAQHHPQPIRYLVQEMAECSVLISGVVDTSEIVGLPILSPDVFSELAQRPQTAAWLEANRIPPGQAVEPQEAEAEAPPGPTPDPSYAPQFDPSQSPYPSAEPEETQPAPVIQEPPAEYQVPPQAPSQGPDWTPAGPPRDLPGDRRR